MYNHKLKAFTIAELLVALVISGLIIAGAFSFYLNYEGLIRRKTNQMECGKDVIQFYTTFKHEFELTPVITFSGNQLGFLNDQKIPVHYEFEDSVILRMLPETADTFYLRVDNFNIINDQASGLPRMVSFELQSCGEVFPVVLEKQYPNDVLVNSRK